MLGLKQTAMRIDALSEYRRAGYSYYWHNAGFTDVNDYEAVYHWRIRRDFESSWYAEFKEQIELKLALEKAEEKKRQDAERQAILAQALEGVIPPTIDSFTAMDFASYGIENTVTSDERSAVADDDSYNPYDEIVSAVDDSKEDNMTIEEFSLGELTSEDANAAEIIDPDVVDCDEADDTNTIDTDDDRTIDFDPAEFLARYCPDSQDVENICAEWDAPLVGTVTDDDKAEPIEDGVEFSSMSEADNENKRELTPLGKVLEMLHHWNTIHKR